MTEITRMEKFLRACIDGVPCALTPLTRVEKLLAQLNETLAGQAPVVILPETELVPVEVAPGEMGMYNIVDTPIENTPTAGATGKLVWGGVEYTSKITDISAMSGLPDGSYFCMGNLDMSGELPPDLAHLNPAPDAPYMLMFLPDGMPTDAGTTYGQMISRGITPDTPVLSIVQVGGASGGGNADGGVVIATGTIQNDGTIASADKTYAELLAAHNAGKHVLFKATSQYATMVLPLVTHMTYGNEYLAFGVNIDTQKLTAKAALLYYADGTLEYTST